MAPPSKAHHTAESISELAKRMQSFAARFRALAEDWKADGFETLAVTRDDQRARAIKFLNTFSGAVEAAMDEEREKRALAKAGSEKPTREKKAKSG